MSLRRVKSTPYFLAQGLNAPMFASVTSMLVRAAPWAFSCFRLCLPWCSFGPLARCCKYFFQGGLQRLGGELARFHGQGNGFLGDFFLHSAFLLGRWSEKQRLGWNHQPPQVKGSHGWTLLSVRCLADGPNQAAPYRAPQGTHSSC